MKGPITGTEVRYRLAGLSDESGWTYLRFGLVRGIDLSALLPEEEYDVGVRYLGPVPSPWTTFTHTVAATTRRGPLALPPVNVGNVGAIWDTGAEVTWEVTDTLADISVSAGNLIAGDQPAVAYSASAGQIAGVAEEVKTVHLYYDDPKFAGGLRTLGITESQVTARSGHPGRIYIATLTITFDVAGGTGTGGGGSIAGGGGGSGTKEP